MRLTNVMATPSIPPEYKKSENTASKAANCEMDSIIISEDARTVSDWSKQFQLSFNTGKTDNIFASAIEDYKGVPFSQFDDMYEYGADTYTKLKEQIDTKFGGDDEKRKLYMTALDNAFDSFIGKQSFMTSRRLDQQRKTAEMYSQHSDQLVKEPNINPLAVHKDFNADELYVNLKKTGEDFVKAFTDGAKNSLVAAWENVNKTLGSMTTTSVNNVSFNDMRIILSGLSTWNNDLSGDIGALWHEKYNALADNTNLSDFMRNVFK